MDSVRQDVGCFFGVLMGCLRILNFPILYREKDDIDNVFFTCCMLHDMVHAYDGLDVLEVDVGWTGVYSLHDPEVAESETDHGWVMLWRKFGDYEVQEIESEHHVLKEKLIAHNSYRRKIDGGT